MNSFSFVRTVDATDKGMSPARPRPAIRKSSQRRYSSYPPDAACQRAGEDSRAALGTLAEPFVVQLLIRPVLLQGEQRLVHLFSQGTVVREDDPITLLAEDRSHDLNFALALSVGVIEEHGRIEND